MFFLIVIIALIAYRSQAVQAAPGEMWFMMSIFLGLGYIAGFLDSRLFARFDRKKGNMLAEAEERYEQNIEGAGKPV